MGSTRIEFTEIQVPEHITPNEVADLCDLDGGLECSISTASRVTAIRVAGAYREPENIVDRKQYLQTRFDRALFCSKFHQIKAAKGLSLNLIDMVCEYLDMEYSLVDDLRFFKLKKPSSIPIEVTDFEDYLEKLFILGVDDVKKMI